MNQKSIGIIIAFLATIIVMSPLIGAAVAKNVKNKENNVTYELVVYLLGPSEVTLRDDSGAPELIIREGFCPIESIFAVNAIIDDVSYSYPEDFTYEHSFHLEYNAITLETNWEIEVVLTFNLPGNPTITDWCVTQGTNVDYPNQITEGTITLTGTGIFDKVKGVGMEEAWFTGVGEIFFAHRVGVMKGWPL